MQPHLHIPKHVADKARRLLKLRDAVEKASRRTDLNLRQQMALERRADELWEEAYAVVFDPCWARWHDNHSLGCAGESSTSNARQLEMI